MRAQVHAAQREADLTTADLRKAVELKPGNIFDSVTQAIAKTELDQLARQKSCSGSGRGNDDQRCL